MSVTTARGRRSKRGLGMAEAQERAQSQPVETIERDLVASRAKVERLEREVDAAQSAFDTRPSSQAIWRRDSTRRRLEVATRQRDNLERDLIEARARQWRAELAELEAQRGAGPEVQEAEGAVLRALAGVEETLAKYGRLKEAARSAALRAEGLKRALGRDHTSFPPSIGLTTAAAAEARQCLERIETALNRCLSPY